MTLIAAWVVTGLLAGPGSEVAHGIEASIERGLKRVGQLEEELRQAKRGLVKESKRDQSRIALEKARADARRRANKKPLDRPPRIVFETREEKTARVEELEALLAEARRIPSFPKAQGLPAPGFCGKIDPDCFKVLEVAGPRQVRGQISWHHGREMEIDGLTQHVPITTVRTKPLEIWLSGVDTSAMVSGKTSEVKEPIIVLSGGKGITNSSGGQRKIAAGRALTAEEIKRVKAALSADGNRVGASGGHLADESDGAP